MIGQLYVQIRSMLDQPVSYLDHSRVRNRQSELFCKSGGEHFVCEHFDVLRIVAKLNDIEMTIRTTHQVSLGPTAHPSYVLNSFERQNAASVYGFGKPS